MVQTFRIVSIPFLYIHLVIQMTVHSYKESKEIITNKLNLDIMLQMLDRTDNTGEIIVLFVRGTGYPPALHGDGG